MRHERKVSEKGPLERRELEAVLERCRAIEERGLNPFTLDIDSILRVVREYFPSWEEPEELSLDAATINQLASVIRLQSEWLQRRSTSLYMDPLIVERRLKELGREELASAISMAWQPVVESETLTIESMREAAEYWASLPAQSERWPQLPGSGSSAGLIDREEFLKSNLFGADKFESRLDALYNELTKTAGKEKVPYWDFISTDSFDETVERSYLASFLVSYGWATLQIHPIEGDVFIKPLQKTAKISREKTPTSIVLSISREEWERRRTH